MGIMDATDTGNMANRKREGEGQDAHSGCKMEEACVSTTGDSKTDCFIEIFQRKYKCFILYAVILVSVCEFFYLIFTSQDVGRDDYVNLISRFLNRTANVKI